MDRWLGNLDNHVEQEVQTSTCNKVKVHSTLYKYIPLYFKKNPEMRALKSFFLWQYNKEYYLICDKLLIRSSLCSKINRNIDFADKSFFSTRSESRQLQRTWRFSPRPCVRRDWSSEWEDLSPHRNSAHIPSSIWWMFHPTKEENFNIENNFSFLQIVL